MRKTLLALMTAALSAAAEPTTIPPTYVCQRTTSPLHIDGKGTETDWQSAVRLSPLRDIEGAAIEDNTVIRLLWDDSYLYVLADMKETHLWATLQERDSIIYHDPDFEVFIDPEGDARNYVEIEVNALNTVWELFLTAPYRSSGHALHDWNIPGLKSAVQLRGTLNKSGDTDEGWSVEMAIPWESITGHSAHPRRCAPPTAGTVLRMNFSRVNWQVQPDNSSTCGYRKQTDANGTPLPESNHVWAPTGVINIHCPEHWGYVKLSANPAGSGYEGMEQPATTVAQQRLFAWYRAQLDYRAKHGSYSTDIQHPGVNVLFCNQQLFAAQTTATDGQLLSIDSQGVLTTTPAIPKHLPLYLWVQGGKHTGDTTWWQQHFTRLAGAGVHAVIIGGTVEQITHLTPIARAEGLQVYAWMWALNRPQDTTALQHPDWYAVNRCGKSCHAPANRPFVEYYQFLCPNSEGALKHLLNQVDKLAAIPGLSGIQLDYLRMPDVILPRGLWGKYGLDMSRELPEYDYCYCERCQAEFRTTTGRDIATDAEQDTAWREFRLESVARVANALCRRIRSHNLRSACAVFPTPKLAAKLVRQNWADFELDLALPMVYHSFYNKTTAWAATCSQEAAEQTAQRLPLAPGIHLPDSTAASLQAELDNISKTAPAGIGLFCDDDLTPDLLQALQQWCKKDN
ncbi:MAG: carbohydrate-binding family 9-like protein [Akkermansia sp.]|nr:carbohydrate-binding family 9-like protein [Akkermansia sp.]